ncbi:MAG: hypothetical protein FJY07_10055 [Bacteroidetes bacterium]|nr:hypothetical protein [Bacteroidota bacterium]
MNATKALSHKVSQNMIGKSLFVLVLLLTLISCNSKQAGKALPENKMKGNWAFLDGRGNYNEAYFADSTFVTYNMVMGKAPEFRYALKNDSLYTNTNKRKKGLNRIARVEWLDGNKVIFTTEFSRDTLERITGENITLETTDPKTDSIFFKTQITRRYEKFLVTRGIITPEEIDAFKKEGAVPGDVREEGK